MWRALVDWNRCFAGDGRFAAAWETDSEAEKGIGLVVES